LAGKSQLTQADFIAAEQRDDAGPLQGLGLGGMTLEQVERSMIEQALDQHRGNISRVASALGLSRTALYRRLERHGLGTGVAEPE
jgi:two-component system NtrC family response regulator